MKKSYPVRGERLKAILEETGISQGELARMTGIAQQNISSAIRQEKNLSETSARLITDALPQYRFEWLFGLDDYKTEAEFTLSVLGTVLAEGNALNAAVCTLAQLCGYSVSRVDDRLKSGSIEKAIKEVKKGYEYKGKKGRTFSLTLEEQSCLEREVREFVEFKLSKKANLAR